MDDALHNSPLIPVGLSVVEIRTLLDQHGALEFPQLSSGLFPAINVPDLKDPTGMTNAWLRDSANVALGLLQDGQTDEARAAGRGILDCLQKVRTYFDDVIAAGSAPADASLRPAVRFTGDDSRPRLEWPNAQNDALGYSLLLIGNLAQAGALKLTPADREMLATVLDYLHTIRYWEDLDSGHWEEVPKLNSSSVGTVIAGLQALAPSISGRAPLITELLTKGRQTLERVLPNESDTPGWERPVDASQLFLIEPLHVVRGEMATTILNNIQKTLVGPHGVRRYPRDSYWGADYRSNFEMGERTVDFSDPKDMVERDAFFRPGTEAQWSLFDPMLAAAYARRYEENESATDRDMAHRHLSRSLSQVIETEVDGKTVWRIPESYFLENNRWVPNDHLGLLWSQGNLLHALAVFSEVFGDQPVRA